MMMRSIKSLPIIHARGFRTSVVASSMFNPKNLKDGSLFKDHLKTIPLILSKLSARVGADTLTKMYSDVHTHVSPLGVCLY